MFEPLASYQLSHITIGKLLLSLTNSNQVEPHSSFIPVSKLLTLSRQNKVARNQDNNMLYSTVAEIVSLTNIITHLVVPVRGFSKFSLWYSF